MENKSIKFMFEDENLFVESLDGQVTLFNSKDIFKGGVDIDLERLGINYPEKPTAETFFDICDVAGTNYFLDTFLSVTTDLNGAVLTQNQITRFCEKYPDYLGGEKAGTFFLIKNDKGYFIINVTIHNLMIKGVNNEYSPVDIDITAGKFGLSPTVRAIGSSFPKGHILRVVIPRVTGNNL
jgi:hypothetical protein